MSATLKKDYMIVGGFAIAFLVLVYIARERPKTPRELGAELCQQQGELIEKIYPTITKRPPYHNEPFTPQTKIVIICKKKDLH